MEKEAAGFLEVFDPALRPYVGQCLDGELLSRQELILRLDRYAEELSGRVHQHEFLDLTTARALDARCRVMLSRLEDLAPWKQRLVQVAVLYFVLEDDAESDSDSIVGFDDDEEVVAAVERALEGGEDA